MRSLLILLSLALAAPAQAQDAPSMDRLLDRFEDLSKEAQTLLEGWIEDLGPKIDELGPALEELADKLGDLSAYDPPVVLDNGDILIRRKKPTTPTPTDPPPDPPTDTPPPQGDAIDL